MIEAYKQLFCIIVIMLYLLYKYPKHYVLHAVGLIAIPLFVVANWHEFNMYYALYLLIIVFVLNFTNLYEQKFLHE